MMASGELDAVMFYLVDPNLIDRSTVDLHNHPDIKPLFPDSVAEGVRYYRKTGLYPINHGTVIKRELAEKYPWALTNILKAFQTGRGAQRPPAGRARRILLRDRHPARAGPAGLRRAAYHPQRCGEPQGARNDCAVFAGAGVDAEAHAARGPVSAEHAQSVTVIRSLDIGERAQPRAAPAPAARRGDTTDRARAAR
jgi:hypothetical protein